VEKRLFATDVVETTLRKKEIIRTLSRQQQENIKRNEKVIKQRNFIRIVAVWSKGASRQ